jgi:hypothetical protein
VTYDGDWRETFRPDIPSVARIYDYLLADRLQRAGRAAVPVHLALRRRRGRPGRDHRQAAGRAAIRDLVDGMDIVEPGLAWPPEWRPDPGDEVPDNAAESYYCVVVARTS